MLTPEEFSKLKTGTLIETCGSIYFIVFVDGSTTPQQVIEWCETYHLVSLVQLNSAVLGYNITEPLDNRQLNLFANGVNLAKKQFTKQESNAFYIKLKMLNLLPQEKEFEHTLEQGKSYFLTFSYISAELQDRLCNTEDEPRITRYLTSMHTDTYLVKPVQGGFDVYAIHSRVNGKLYAWKKTFVKKGTTDKVLKPLEQTLLFPYWKTLPVLNDGVKMAKAKIKSPLDDYMQRLSDIESKLVYIRDKKPRVYEAVLSAYRQGTLYRQLLGANETFSGMWFVMPVVKGAFEIEEVVGRDKDFEAKIGVIYAVYEKVLKEDKRPLGIINSNLERYLNLENL